MLDSEGMLTPQGDAVADDTAAAPPWHQAKGEPRIVMLTDGAPLSWMTANAVAAHFGPITLIHENSEPKSIFIKRRLRLIGPIAVAGQLAFAVLQKFMKKRSLERLRDIIETHDLDPRPSSIVTAHAVPSVNSEECQAHLRALKPDVVLVHGTRIIKRATLRAVDAPFINFHAGINPAYRGQHGAYWALATGDTANAGATVHLIDEGVDTGDVLYQVRITPDKRDSINTYQYLQAATAIPIFIKAAEDALDGELKVRKINLPSKQWFHPTLWGYVYTGLTRGVW